MKKITERIMEDKFDFPSPPESIPGWADQEALSWIGLDDFDVLVQAEKRTGRLIEIEYVSMSVNLWGLHVASGKRVMIYVNRSLPIFWKRFALFHELFHLLYHTKGHSFWSRTATPMNSFEHQADMFAWAVVLREWMEEIVQ